MIKGAKIAGLDPDTEEMASLFHPFKQRWSDHFTWQAEGLLIAGLTPTGRATVNVIKLNRSPLVKVRRW